jgi:hypothetical protein
VDEIKIVADSTAKGKALLILFDLSVNGHLSYENWCIEKSF